MTDAYNRAVARIEKFLNGVSLAMDAGEHWVTVNAGSASGGEGGGSHVMLDGEGRVKAGMGGKFTGTRIDDIPRKKFMGEKAYQRKQERDTPEAKAKAAKPARATKSKAKEVKAPFTPSQPMHPALKRNEDGSMSVKFDGYPGREVLDKIKAQGFKYDGETRTWTLSKRKATDEAIEAINNDLHSLKPVSKPAPRQPEPRPQPQQTSQVRDPGLEALQRAVRSAGPGEAMQAAQTMVTPSSSGTPAPKAEPYTIENQNKAMRLKKMPDGTTEVSVNFGGYPGREVLDELKGEGLRYDGDTRTWSIRTSQSDAPAKINEILTRHTKPTAPPVKIPQATMSRITAAGLTESKTSPGRFYMPRTSVYNPEAADRAYNDLFGLKITRYGTGNVSSAELDGEKISNSHAKHLIGMSSAANFDTSTGKWNKLDPELQAIWDKRQGAQS